MSEEKQRFVQVAPALAQLRALIEQVDKKVAAFAALAQEAEASLAEKAQELVNASKSELERMAKEAADAAAAEAIRRVEATRADLDERVAQIQATLALVETALSADLDGDGQVGTVTIGAAPTGAATAGAASLAPSDISTPRLQQLIEQQQEDRREIARLRKSMLWLEHALKALCEADGFPWTHIAGKADQQEGRANGAAAE